MESIRKMDEVPHTVRCTASSIILKWDEQITNKSEYANYEVKFKVDGTRTFMSCVPKEGYIEINNLKSDTLYNISICGNYDDGGASVIFKVDIETKESKLTHLMENAEIDRATLPNIYQLKPVYTYTDEDDRFRTCHIIARDRPDFNHSDVKILLILGATGTGKSTFIDALFNYIAGVSFSDDFRYSIINKSIEEKEREQKQFLSQTRSVVKYTIPKTDGLLIDYTLEIIDTPGFNDTTKDFDETIVTTIHDLFKQKINHLDAVLIVVPASVNRLTEGQEYVYTSIRKIFGIDIDKNMFVITTHHDGGIPVCLPFLKEVNIPCTHVFKFNNSNLFSKTDGSSVNSVWSDRAKSFSELFVSLEGVQKTSVLSSVEVMAARFNLELQIISLRKNLTKQIQDIINYKKSKQIKTSDRLFLFEKADTVSKHEFTGKTSINCTTCKHTCHENCWVIGDKFIWSCKAMNKSKCTACQGKCGIEKHCREKFKYHEIIQKKTISGEEFLCEVSLEDNFSEFVDTINKINTLVNELKTKALFPESVSTASLMESMTKKEQEEKQPQFEVRIKIIERVVAHITKEPIRDLCFDSLTKGI